MVSTTHPELLGIAGLCTGRRQPARILEQVLPPIRSMTAADALLVRRTAPDGVQVVAGDGAVPGVETLTGLPALRTLPGGLGELVLVGGDDDHPDLPVALALVEAALAHAVAEEEYADLVARVDNAQHLASMGDYDWHIPSDTNRWSDELYRIYGFEAGAFNPSYEKFLSMIHPEDRERIAGIHQEAYRTGEPYQMIERIVRPTGEVRYLSSNGQVVMDENGTPVRMRGTCIDITDRVIAESEREQIAARFRGLVEADPDAILVLDDAGRILEANPRAHELLGGDPSGHVIQEVLSGAVGEAEQGRQAVGIDGRELLLDVTPVAVGVDSESLVALFLHDGRARLEREAIVARLGEAKLRRRQALEINDNVVQGLVAAAYALDQDDTRTASLFLQKTLGAARSMMDDLLEPLDGEGLHPGDLVRSAAADIGSGRQNPAERPAAEQTSDPRKRVLVVDDADDLRLLLRTRLERSDNLTVVGEAGDGFTAVELAHELQPDLVLLDLAMPRMDGLEALPHIRSAVPHVRVVVLSGFNQQSLAEKALAAGADRYVVKGGSLRELVAMVEGMLGKAAPGAD